MDWYIGLHLHDSLTIGACYSRQSLSELALKVRAPSIELVLLGKDQAVLVSTLNFDDILGLSLLSTSKIWYLNWIKLWLFISNTKLTFVIHAPRVDIAFLR